MKWLMGDIPKHFELTAGPSDLQLIDSFRATQPEMLAQVVLTEIAGSGLDFAKIRCWSRWSVEVSSRFHLDCSSCRPFARRAHARDCRRRCEANPSTVRCSSRAGPDRRPGRHRQQPRCGRPLEPQTPGPRERRLLQSGGPPDYGEATVVVRVTIRVERAPCCPRHGR